MHGNRLSGTREYAGRAGPVREVFRGALVWGPHALQAARGERGPEGHRQRRRNKNPGLHPIHGFEEFPEPMRRDVIPTMLSFLAEADRRTRRVDTNRGVPK